MSAEGPSRRGSGFTPAVTAAALLAVVVWGASPVGTKLAVAELAPLAVAALRTVLAGAVALPVALALGIAPPAGNGRRALLALSAFCGFVAFPALFSIGIRLTSATHGAMILALLPVMTGAIALAWDRRRPAARWWLGSAVALAGEAMLALARGGDDGEAGLAGDAIVLVSALFAATGYVAGGRLKQAGYPAQGTTYWGVALASLALLPALPWLLGGIAWAAVSPPAWGGVLYLAFGVTILGYLCWYWALGKGGIAAVGVLQFLQPVSGVALAALLLGEAVGATLFAAGALVIAGVWIATRPG